MVITGIEQIDSAWLTAALTRSGALTHGRVTAFDVDSGGGNWSDNGRLRLHYSADARGDQPARLFLKLVDTDTGDGEYFLPLEVTTYTHSYVDVPDAPLLRCYDAAYDAERHRYHLLLDDVTETHRDARDVAPSQAYGLALAEAFAILHARWWRNGGPARHSKAPSHSIAPRHSATPRHSAGHVRRFVAIAQPGAAHVKTHLADALQPHWPDLLDTLFAELPDLLVRRARNGRDLTLIHGDPNPGNILVPRAGVQPLYLIDCQPFDWSLITWLGAYDLAYAMALYWETAVRRALEMAVLRHYHAHLQQRGVAAYPWEQLLDDYRLSVALCVTVAVEYMRGGPNPRWHDFIAGMLQRTLTACDDLDCHTLWQA